MRDDPIPFPVTAPFRVNVGTTDLERPLAPGFESTQGFFKIDARVTHGHDGLVKPWILKRF